MRSARKLRVEKSVPSQKSATSPFFEATEVIEPQEVSRTAANPIPWVEPRGMRRVPTHAVRVVNDRRAYCRAQLQLPLRILRIAGHRESDLDELRTVDISSSGLRTLCPVEIAVGTPVHLEVNLVRRSGHSGDVRLVAQAEVVRVSPDSQGWHSVAFSFDEITFQRDELMAPRFIRV